MEIEIPSLHTALAMNMTIIEIELDHPLASSFAIFNITYLTKYLIYLKYTSVKSYQTLLLQYLTICLLQIQLER